MGGDCEECDMAQHSCCVEVVVWAVLGRVVWVVKCRNVTGLVSLHVKCCQVKGAEDDNG